jgi:hypothetical protein
LLADYYQGQRRGFAGVGRLRTGKMFIWCFLTFRTDFSVSVTLPRPWRQNSAAILIILLNYFSTLNRRSSNPGPSSSWARTISPTSLVWAIPALAQGPAGYIRGILDQVMTIQNNSSLSRSDRRQQIHQIIRDNFDFNTMAKTVLGSSYNQLSTGQVNEFNSVFSYLFQDYRVW